MIPHPEYEEDLVLPLICACLMPEQVAPISHDIVAHEPKIAMGSFIYFDGGPQAFRSGFMMDGGIPSFAWFVDFHWKYQLFVMEFIGPVEALKKGEKPGKSTLST